MAKACIGFDIGDSLLKIVSCTADGISRVVAEPVPDHYVKNGRIVSPEAMAEFLKETAKKYGIRGKDCNAILPDSHTFIRRITTPRMTLSQLKLNLPYEFRDYISKEKDKYFYDYAVLKQGQKAGAEAGKNAVEGAMEPAETEQPQEMELLAVAAEKELIAAYIAMFRQAGFRLKQAAPQVCAFANLLRIHPEAATKDSCIVDVGHSATRIYIFSHGNFETSKVIDYGVELIDEIVSDIYNVDEHVARSYKELNYNEVLSDERCQNLYSAIGVEVMKTINFYNFNNPEAEMESIYYCGGGSFIPGVIESIAGYTGLTMKSVAELLPPCDSEIQEQAGLYADAVGITMQ